MLEIVKVLMNRDGMTQDEAENLVAEAREDFYANPDNYVDADDFMEDWFGLEPDYFFEVV